MNTTTSNSSVYLLGQSTQSSAILERYQYLQAQCSLLGEFLSVEDCPDWLSCYEKDAQPLHTKWPLLVFRPHATTDIAPFMTYCYQLKIPVTVRCGGTSLTGGSIASTAGVILLTNHFKQIQHYDPFQGTLSVEPGVTIKQLHHHIEADDWFFPLEIATAGIAGLASCLSTHARGYHQQEKYFFDVIHSVTLVDGQGTVHHQVPSALVCGAEGLWGVIIEMHLKLKHRLCRKHIFLVQASWEEVLTHLPVLRSLQTLAFIVESHQQFYIGLEGEEWRLTCASAFLAQLFPHPTLSYALPRFMVTQQLFVMLTSTLTTTQLPHAMQWALNQARELQLECVQQADLLAGSVHFILQADVEPYEFTHQTQKFLVLWTDYLDQCKGKISSCHGIGKQFSPYMPPFWSEETRSHWHTLQSLFDPAGLLSQERFFPVPGKSLEKTRYED